MLVRQVPSFLDAQGETFQRVQDGRLGDHLKQAAADAQLTGQVQQCQRRLIIEQDLMVLVADQHAFMQIAQQG